MKKTFLILVFNFSSLVTFAQWTTGTNITYTDSKVVSIGASTVQGSYGDANASIL